MCSVFNVQRSSNYQFISCPLLATKPHGFHRNLYVSLNKWLIIIKLFFVQKKNNISLIFLHLGGFMKMCVLHTIHFWAKCTCRLDNSIFIIWMKFSALNSRQQRFMYKDYISLFAIILLKQTFEQWNYKI